MEFDDIRWQHALDLVQKGEWIGAQNLCKSLVSEIPNHVSGWRMLANIQLRLSDIHGAIVSLSNLARLIPSDADVLFNLGSAYAHTSQFNNALNCYDSASRISPQNPDYHFSRALTLRNLNRLEEAMDSLNLAMQFRPNQVELFLKAGDIALELKNYHKALRYYLRAFELSPRSPISAQNIGWTYHFMGELELSHAYCQKAVELDPNSEQSHIFLGNALNDLGRIQEAIQSYEKAIAINPNSSVAHANLGKLLLRVGDFPRGWKEHEWRLPVSGQTQHEKRFSQPAWDGSSAKGKTILLYGEQGLGDQIQFFRYCRNVRELGAQVILQANPRLHRILRSSDGFFDQLIGKETPPAFDYHASLMSLPGILGTTLETIPRYTKYLSAESEMVSLWKQRLGFSDKMKVGILWQGNPNYLGDRFRSIPLQCFEGLMELKNIRWINLQTSDVALQLKNWQFGALIEDYSVSMDVGSDAFIDTAAIIENLDLVITCDSSIGHLAGALGAATWILISNDAEWRWFINRSDSPWYPSVQLFRQTKLGDWSSVFNQVRSQLEPMAKGLSNSPSKTNGDSNTRNH